MRKVEGPMSIKFQLIFELYQMPIGQRIFIEGDYLCKIPYEAKRIDIGVAEALSLPEIGEKIRINVFKKLPFLEKTDYLLEGGYFDFKGNNLVIDARHNEQSIFIYQGIRVYVYPEEINKYLDTTLYEYKEKWGEDGIKSSNIRKLNVDDLITIYHSTEHEGIKFEVHE